MQRILFILPRVLAKLMLPYFNRLQKFVERWKPWVINGSVGLILLASLSLLILFWYDQQPKDGLFLLGKKEIRKISFTDDLDYEGLSDAITQSIVYYKRVPKTQKYHFDNEIYSSQELRESLMLFQYVIRAYKSPERENKIRQYFKVVEGRRENGEAFFTGYYEPLLRASLKRSKRYPIPVYYPPRDVIYANLGEFNPDLRGKRLAGRVRGKRFIPYDSRDEIVYKRSLRRRARILAYVTSHTDLFFLQVQGSGILKLPSGREIRVNYASQNGQPYRSIGGWFRRRFPDQEVSMQSIRKYLSENPRDKRKILNLNPSYVFFKKGPKVGPIGAINVPVTPKRSLAADTKFSLKGGLAYIEVPIPVFNDSGEIIEEKIVRRFALIQDRGGAIKGPGRADIFWGNGQEAERTAGHLQSSGKLFLLVAKKEYLRNPELLDTIR